MLKDIKFMIGLIGAIFLFVWAIGWSSFLQNEIGFIRRGGDVSESTDRFLDKFEKDVEDLVMGEIKPILILASLGFIGVIGLVLWIYFKHS